MKLSHFNIYIIILFLNLIFSNSQIECGSQLENNKSYNLDEILSQNTKSSRYIYDRDDFWSPVSFHIVRDSNSSG